MIAYIKRNPLVAILVLAFLLRILYTFGYARGIMGIAPEKEETDGYHLIAENLYHGHGYKLVLERPPTLERPPGYPVFLYFLFELFGIRYDIVQISHALLGALSCWILFHLGKWIHSQALGLICAFLLAIYPPSIEYSARLYSENFYFPVFLAFAFFFCRSSWFGSVGNGFLTGLIWGGSILTRGTLLLLTLVLPFGIALSKHHRVFVRWRKWSVPAILGAVLIVFPWTYRNYLLTESFVPVSSWGWAPFYHGIQVSKKMLEWGDLYRVDKDAAKKRYEIVLKRLYNGDEAKAYTSSKDYLKHERVAQELVIEELKADPLGAVGRGFLGIFFTWFQTLGAKLRILSLIIHFPLMVLFIWGAFLLAKKCHDAFVRAYPVLGLILYVNLFQAFVYPHVRYMAPAISLSFIFSGFVLYEIFQKKLSFLANR